MENRKSKVHLLLSGGIDSAACLQYFQSMGAMVSPLFVDYGQPARDAEKKSAESISEFYGVRLRTISVLGASVPNSGEILGRNSLLISTALLNMNPGVGLISLGIHAGSPYFDCGTLFVDLWDKLLHGYTDGKVQLSVPFLRWAKTDIISFCSDHNVPLSLTWSCESGANLPCGKCLSCKDRESLNARP
jgi:7-cyano-7-deazaguanine synthase